MAIINFLPATQNTLFYPVLMTPLSVGAIPKGNVGLGAVSVLTEVTQDLAELGPVWRVAPLWSRRFGTRPDPQAPFARPSVPTGRLPTTRLLKSALELCSVVMSVAMLNCI